MRINYYPPSDSAIGAPAHTDFCGLALLVSNEVPGLQVFKDDHWFDVEYINSAVIVLIGDQIMVRLCLVFNFWKCFWGLVFKMCELHAEDEQREVQERATQINNGCEKDKNVVADFGRA